MNINAVLLLIFLVSPAGAIRPAAQEYPAMPAGSEEERRDREPVQITNRSTIPQVIDGAEYYLHAVLPGQTLYSIARAYNVDEETIIEENPDIRDGLRFDQIIRIPVKDDPDRQFLPPVVVREEVAPAPEGSYVEHEVQRRETLFGLSREYGITIDELLFYNPQAREGLQVGQVLQIPVQQEDGAVRPYRKHTVLAGETAYGISRQYGLTVEELGSWNPDIADGLRAGQQIRIPLNGDPHARVADVAPVEEYIFLPRERRPRIVEPDIDPYCFDPEQQDEYKVALLIPLYLERITPEVEMITPGQAPDPAIPGDTLIDGPKNLAIIDSLTEAEPGPLPPDHPSFSFISYYHGVLLALDSINQTGANVSLRVYDVCQDISKAEKVTGKAGFGDTDLIIGPFHRQTLTHVARYGKQYGIPVVSPLLPDLDQLEGFPGLFKATPSLESMLHQLAHHVASHYPRQNIILVHNDQPGAARIIESFRDTLMAEVAMSTLVYDSLHRKRVDGYYFDGTLVGNRRTDAVVMADALIRRWLPHGELPSEREETFRLRRPPNVQDVVYRKEGFEGLLSKLQRDKNNVIITLIGGEPFVADYLRRLHEQRRFYTLTLFGIDEWQDYISIEIDYLQDLRVHFFTSGFYDYSEEHIRNFVRRYRQVFLTEPDRDALKAVHTSYFFFRALTEYGPGFADCIPLLNNLGYESPFAFSRVKGADSGWENSHTYIYRIQNYQAVDVQRPVDDVISLRPGTSSEDQ